MPKRETGSNPDEAIVALDADCEVTLPDRVRNDLGMLCWLHHRVVDLLASHDHTDLMIQDVEDRLAVMSPDMVDDAVNDLIREARAARRAVSRG